jgi:hypothetical protein
LLLSVIPLAVKFLQRGQGIARELSSLISKRSNSLSKLTHGISSSSSIGAIFVCLWMFSIGVPEKF